MIPGTVVLWAEPTVRAGHPLLDGAERDRCSRFRLAVDSARHATARVVAKRATAALLDLPAGDLAVVPESGATPGRPAMRHADGSAVPLHVSIAHAGGLVGVALSDNACGLDVEEVESLRAVVGSDLVYTPAERHELAHATPAVAVALAARWWTAKEALLKCVGRGLLEPAEQLDVRTSPVTVLVAGTPHALAWQPLSAAPGHAAALARPVGSPGGLTVVRVRDVDDPFGDHTRVSTSPTS